MGPISSLHSRTKAQPIELSLLNKENIAKGPQLKLPPISTGKTRKQSSRRKELKESHQSNSAVRGKNDSCDENDKENVDSSQLNNLVDLEFFDLKS